MNNEMQAIDETLIAGYSFFDLLVDGPILGEIGDDKCWPVSI